MQAVELAEKHQFPQIQSLLAKYASHLLENTGPQGRINAIELYRKDGTPLDPSTRLPVAVQENAAVIQGLRSDHASDDNKAHAAAMAAAVVGSRS